MSETKFNFITDRINKNAKSLKFFNALLTEAAEPKRVEIVQDFVTRFGCFPSEAEVIVEMQTINGKRGIRLEIQKMVR